MAPTKRSKQVFEEALPETYQKEHDSVEEEPAKYSKNSINSTISSKNWTWFHVYIMTTVLLLVSIPDLNIFAVQQVNKTMREMKDLKARPTSK